MQIARVKRGRTMSRFRSFGLPGLVSVLAWLVTSVALAQTIEFAVPGGELKAALDAYTKQAGIQLVYREDDVRGLTTHGVRGAWSTEDALEKILAGTSLKARRDASGAVVVVRGETADVVGGGEERDLRLAQAESAQPTSESVESGVEEVIVTAQRREQNLQDVPISITAVSESKLRALGAYEFADFVRTVPGLTFNEFGHNDGNFVIRGITSDIYGGGIQSTVGLYIDDLPSMDTFAGLSTPDLHLFDINRVEVLRGPQGTLFGSGAMGGAIRVITNKPDVHRFASAVDTVLSATQGGDISYGVSAMVNLPLLEDRLAMRAVGYLRDTGGWVDSQVFGKNRDKEKSIGGRFMMSFVPVEDLTLTGTITYQKSNPRDGSSLNDVIDGKPARTLESPEFVDDKLMVYNLVGEYSFAGMKLRSSTTYADKHVLEQQDATVSTRGIFGPDAPPSVLNFDDHSSNFFQEIHLFSTGDQRVGWFVGAFLRDQTHRTYDFSWLVPGAEDLYGSGPYGAAGNDIYSYIDRSRTKEKALFGELEFKLTDRLQATVGARFFKNTYDNVNTSVGLLNNGASTSLRASSESKDTWKYVLSYKLSPDAMVYAQASQGYRVGNANPVVPDPTPPQYGPDDLWNYEVGAKTKWLGGRLQLNGAAYYIDWKKMQLAQYTENGFAYVSNVGDTRSAGAELELEAQFTDALSYTMAASYNSAEIRVDNLAIGASKGDRVPGVPHFTLSNQLQYGFELGADRRGYVRLNHQYISDSYSFFNKDGAGRMGDYHVVGLRVGAVVNHWDLALFANNLFNDDSVVAALATGYVYELRPRMIGINARWNF